MIKSIAGGQGVVVSNSTSSWPYFQNYNNNSVVGTIRYDGSTQNIQVYDGNIWHTLSNLFPMIELSPDIHELLQWTKAQRDRDFKIKELALKNTSVADAKKQLDMAKEQLDILVALSDNNKI